MTDAVDHRPDHEHERVHAEHMRPDDREDQMLGVIAMLDDDVARQVHDGDHHGHGREPREERRYHARTADDLAQRRGGLRRALLRRRDQLRNALRVGPNVQSKHEGDEGQHSGTQPRKCQDARVELILAGEDRAEDSRAEDCTDDCAAQYVGDPARATVGRVHVTRGGADEERHAA
ncbi:MAG TPA: hypothetical protein VJL85_07515 [Gaiellaceae bacterium]|nr:hypothetical protein [Gaiellaceae bacterium]